MESHPSKVKLASDTGPWVATITSTSGLRLMPAAIHWCVKVPAFTDDWAVLFNPHWKGRSLLWWGEWKAFGHETLCNTAERLLHRYCTLSPSSFSSPHLISRLFSSPRPLGDVAPVASSWWPLKPVVCANRASLCRHVSIVISVFHFLVIVCGVPGVWVKTWSWGIKQVEQHEHF